MKKLSTYLFLVLFSFSAPSFADDIRDFQIEGMSVGDSLLDYISEEKILNNMRYVYEDNNKIQSKDIAAIVYDKNLIIYDIVQVNFKTYDNIFEIVGLMGHIFFENNMEGCYKKQNQIFDEISLISKGAETKKGDLEDHQGYPKGEVKIKSFSFFLRKNERSNLEVVCFDAIEKLKLRDRLSVSLKSKEFNNWMEELYK